MKSIGTLKIIPLRKSFKAKSRNQSSNKERLNNKPDRFDQVYSAKTNKIKETFTYSHGIKVNLTFSKDQDIEVLIANEEGIYPQKGERQRIHQIYSSEARSIVLSIIPIEHLIINSLGECIPILTNKETSDILELDLSINEVLYKGIINKKEIQKIFIDGKNYWNPDLKTFIILDCTPD